MRRRETGLLLFALAVVGASLLTETRRDAGAAAPVAGNNAARGSENPQRRGEVAALDMDEWLVRLKARGMNTQPSGPGLFGGASWQPQSDPAASLPVKPQTPPFPFVLLGRMKLGDSTVVVVAKGEVSYTAKVGQVIEQFRIDRIDDDGLRVTYVPNGEARDYRYEQLYASVGAPPGSPMQAAAPMQQAQGADSPDVQVQQQAQSSPAAAEKPAVARVGVAAGTAATAAAGAIPPNPTVQGAAAPIGGMVLNSAQPGSGMVITPVPPGVGMVVIAPQTGSGMLMTQPAAGIGTPGIGTPGPSGAQSGSNSAPAPQ